MKDSNAFLYLKIAESLRQSIRHRLASGELQPGDKLPPVREMARNWKCTPGTVSRAYAELAAEGLIEGQRGGGTRITASAHQPERPALHWAALVNQADQFLLTALSSGHTPAQVESALSLAIARWNDLRLDEGRPPRFTVDVAALNFAGSHDLAVEILAHSGMEAGQASMTVQYIGSLGGLMALAQGKARIAGTHLWDEMTDTYNEPFVRHLLPGRRLALLTVAHRSLGWIVPPGNPNKVETLSDLTRPDVRLVNRQPGSGTRVWLDAHLKEMGIQPSSVAGYEQETSTHMAVAQVVEKGEATVGLGIQAAAAACGLDFVPLTKERYDLVFPETVWNTPAAQAMVKIIRSAHFKKAVDALGGYDTSETGREVWIS